MCKFLSVLFYVFSGFFLHGLLMVGFMTSDKLYQHVDTLSESEKSEMMIAFTVFFGVLLLIGLAFRGFRNWRAHIATVLLSTSSVFAFFVLTMVCLVASEQSKMFSSSFSSSLDDLKLVFADYFVGGALMLGVIGLGIAFFLSSKAKASVTDPKSGSSLK